MSTDRLTAPGGARYLFRRRATGSRKNRKKAKNPNQAGEWKAKPSTPRNPRNPQCQLKRIVPPGPAAHPILSRAAHSACARASRVPRPGPSIHRVPRQRWIVGGCRRASIERKSPRRWTPHAQWGGGRAVGGLRAELVLHPGRQPLRVHLPGPGAGSTGCGSGADALPPAAPDPLIRIQAGEQGREGGHEGRLSNSGDTRRAGGSGARVPMVSCRRCGVGLCSGGRLA